MQHSTAPESHVRSVIVIPRPSTVHVYDVVKMSDPRKRSEPYRVEFVWSYVRLDDDWRKEQSSSLWENDGPAVHLQ